MFIVTLKQNTKVHFIYYYQMNKKIINIINYSS